MFELLQRYRNFALISVVVASLSFLLWLFFTGAPTNIGVGKCVAEVNGECVSLSDLRIELMNMESFGIRDTKEAIENLINQFLLYQFGKSLGLRVSDKEVAKVIALDPTFQENGGFSLIKYKTILSRINVKPEDYENYIKRNLLIKKTLYLIGNAIYVSSDEVMANLRVQSLRITGRIYFVEKLKRFNYEPKEEEIRKFYEENKSLFFREPKVEVKVWQTDSSDRAMEIYNSLLEGKTPPNGKRYLIPSKELPKELIKVALSLSKENPITFLNLNDKIYVLKFVRVRKGGYKGLEEVRQTIREILREKKRRELLREYALKVKERLKEGKRVRLKYTNVLDEKLLEVAPLLNLRMEDLVDVALSSERVFGPFETNKGYALLLVLSKKIDTGNVKGIREGMRNIKRNSILNRLILLLRKRAKVRVLLNA